MRESGRFFFGRWLLSSTMSGLIFRRILYRLPLAFADRVVRIFERSHLFDKHASLFLNSGEIEVRPRRRGVSVVIRALPQKFPLALAIDSVIPFVDEVVVVFNCAFSSQTAAFEAFLCRHENVRILYYDAQIAPPGKSYMKAVMDDPTRSIARFYNFAFSAANFSTCIKWDDDMLFCGNRRALSCVKRPFVRYSYDGFDVWGDFTTTREPRTFLVRPGVKFFDSENCERLFTGLGLTRRLSKSYLHIKSLKQSFLDL